MKAKKLASGSWNVMVFSHVENGRRKYESFTAPTKAEAMLKASEFKANKKRRVQHDLTVGECIDRYIAAKEAVLSPSTITRYVGMRKNNFNQIEKKRIRNLTSEDLQIFVSQLSETLRPVSPSDDAVRALYNAAYPRLRLCIGLGMMGLREGEICALDYSDLHGKTLHVHKDMVRDRHGKWIIKETPKTSESDRYIDLPPFIIELIGSGEDLIVPISPNGVAKAFIKLRNKLGLSDIRFHDLRHYFASVGALIMPDIYLADLGGWARTGTAPVMKSVYQNNIKSMSEYYNKKIADHMENIVKEDA